MANEKIRAYIKEKNVKHYEVAEVLGMHESQLSRLLRKELDAVTQQGIQKVVDDISNSRSGANGNTTNQANIIMREYLSKYQESRKQDQAAPSEEIQKPSSKRGKKEKEIPGAESWQQLFGVMEEGK